MAKLNATTAARESGMSERTIRTWISAGRLPAIKVDGEWEIDLHDLVRIAGKRSRAVPAKMPEVPPEIVTALEARIEALERELLALKTRVRGVEIWQRPTPSSPVIASPPPAARPSSPTPAPARELASLATVVPAAVSPRLGRADLHGGEYLALPDGMMSRTEAAERHGIALTTLRRQVALGAIETAPGTYAGPYGRFSVARPLTARGLAQFYAWASRRPEFRRCPDCPHEPPTLADVPRSREHGDTMPLLTPITNGSGKNGDE